MNCAGFLNLPEWQGHLQKILTKLNCKELLRSPVLGSENVEHPWVALDSEEFFSAVETGILFHMNHGVSRFPEKLISADAEIALQRISNGEYRNTFFRAAIGATFPILKIFASEYDSAKPERIFSQNDSVAGFILSRMETSQKSIEDATSEAQWEKFAPSNPNLHLHGIVTRNRLALQIVEVFGCVLPLEEIKTVGISSLTVEDVKIAASLGCSIRLLGMAQKTPTGIKAVVEPCMIPMKYFLAQARGGSEIIYAQTEDGQSQVYACPGTSCETIVRGILTDLADCGERTDSLIHVDSVENFSDKFYIRFELMNITDTLAKVLNVFSQNGIDVDSIFQPGTDVSRETETSTSVSLVIVTGKTDSDELRTVLEEVNQKVKLASVVSFFRYIR